MNVMEHLRKKNPLIHCITNYVTACDVANAVLAVGGSPIMADAPEESSEVTGMADALVINLGMLNSGKREAMFRSCKKAGELGLPIVLDPVGVGISAYRRETAAELLKAFPFAAIRGNLSEISYLCGLPAAEKGVDSGAGTGEGAAIFAARKAAKDYRTTVVVTGAEDIVSDGTRTAKIANGVPEMRQITGMGCMLSGILGACAAAEPDTFQAAVTAAAAMGIAGESSLEGIGKNGVGSLHVGILDALGRMDDETVRLRGKIKYDE